MNPDIKSLGLIDIMSGSEKTKPLGSPQQGALKAVEASVFDP